MHPRAYRLKFPEPAPGQGAPPTTLRVRPASPPPAGPGPGDQAALALESRELWVAAHVPDLSLCALHSVARAGPLVVLDPASSRVIAAAPRAAAAGVRVGMTLGAALAAAPDIDPRPRDDASETALMQRLAAIAAAFTPSVSIEPPDGLLLEIKPSIALFGGLRVLCRQLRASCLADPTLAANGVAPHFTLAPTALAALVAARAGARCFITDPRVLPARLKSLPLSVLRWPEEENRRLEAMGVRTLGELTRLPRAGFARRFGKTALMDLDRLLGRRADPRRRLARRERYIGRIDLDHEIEEHERILQAVAPLLAQLEEFLRVRQRGITALQFRFHHYRAAPTSCVLRLAAPEADAQRLASLLRERLANLPLPEPVRRCELRSGSLTARPLASKPLWSPGERGHAPAGEMAALVEQLRARLGASAVYGLQRIHEHRPERAWRVAEPALDAVVSEAPPAAAVRRPVWLLAEPEELAVRQGKPWLRGALDLLEGPERIESGWWDQADAERDYYVARDKRGSLVWIYHECAEPRRWFLHGVFG
jgi:protein ImuB